MTAEHAERFPNRPMDPGPADPGQRPSMTQEELNHAQFAQAMRTFAEVRFTVQGVDEYACLQAIDAKLDEFESERMERQHDEVGFTIVACNFAQQEIGDPPVKIWHAEVTCIRSLGQVPWT